MAKVLILANFELSIELGEGAPAATGDSVQASASLRAKERRLLRFLKKLASEDPGTKGTVESLEFEAWSEAGNPEGYYYNKFTPEDERTPGSQG